MGLALIKFAGTPVKRISDAIAKGTESGKSALDTLPLAERLTRKLSGQTAARLKASGQPWLANHAIETGKAVKKDGMLGVTNVDSFNMTQKNLKSYEEAQMASIKKNKLMLN